MGFEQKLRNAVKNLGGCLTPMLTLTVPVMESKYVRHADMDPWEIATYPLEAKQHTTGACTKVWPILKSR